MKYFKLLIDAQPAPIYEECHGTACESSGCGHRKFNIRNDKNDNIGEFLSSRFN